MDQPRDVWFVRPSTQATSCTSTWSSNPVSQLQRDSERPSNSTDATEWSAASRISPRLQCPQIWFGFRFMAARYSVNSTREPAPNYNQLFKHRVRHDPHRLRAGSKASWGSAFSQLATPQHMSWMRYNYEQHRGRETVIHWYYNGHTPSPPQRQTPKTTQLMLRFLEMNPSPGVQNGTAG